MTARHPAPNRLRRSLLAAALGAPVVATLSGCGGGFADDELPRVRFVNGLVGVSAADFWLEGSLVAPALASNGGRTGYVRTDPGDRRVRVREVGTTTNLLDGTLDFDIETANTVIAYGGGTFARKLRRLEETASLAVAGEVKLRALHAAAGIEALDVFLTTADANLATTPPTFTLGAYDGLTGFATLDTDTYRLVVTRSGSTAIVLDLPSVRLVDRSIYLLAVVPDGVGGVNVVVLAERETGVVQDPK